MAAQKGRLQYIASEVTPARSPYRAAAPYLLLLPYLSEVAIGGIVSIYLDWGYTASSPKYEDDRTLSNSSSGISEVRYFDTVQKYSIKVDEVKELHETEFVKNGTIEVDALFTKGVGWALDNQKASCDGTQTGDSDLTNDGEVVAGTVKTKFTLSGVTAGTITPIIGGVAGTARSADGTFTEDIAATGTTIILRADSSFIGSVDDLSVKTIGNASDFAALNALNLELAKGTVITWWPDWDQSQSDYFSIVGGKRIAPRRLRSQYLWAFDFDFQIAPTIQFPSTVAPFTAA